MDSSDSALVGSPASDAIEDRIDSLLSEMRLEEKVGQLNQLNGGEETGPAAEDNDLEGAIRRGEVGSVLNVDGLEERRRLQRIAVEESALGIPLLFGFDVVHGFRTMYPIPLGEAATWNPDLARRTAEMAARETAASGIHWTFAPPMDVTRDARWGRALETAGEDPYLGEVFARARVRGFQGEDLTDLETVLACGKHYVGYGGVEAGQEYNTVSMSESDLRNVHLPPFEAAIEAGLGSIMNAFNVYDNVPAPASEYLLTDILRDELDFDGVVVSDWNAFRELINHGVAADERDAAEAALTAGSDVDMAGLVFDEALVDLVEDGEVAESTLDAAVRRVLRTKVDLGLFEDPFRYFDEDRRDETVLTDEHRELARESARESIVLLENDDDVLPLDPADDLAIIGGLADSQTDVIGEWRARAEPTDAVTLRDGIDAAVTGTVAYEPGYERSGDVPEHLRADAVAAVEDADVAVVAVGETWRMSGENASRTDIGLPGEQRELVEALASTGTPVVALLLNGRPLAIPWLSDAVSAIVETWFLGIEAGHAVADVLFGEHNPSGRLPMSFPRSVGQVPVYYNHLPTGRPPEGGFEENWVTGYLDESIEPLYPFGYGLSYTDFEYGDLSLSADAIAMDETLSVSVPITNAGSVAGEEVVQLYAHDRVASRSRPVKELVGFENVQLTPGETRRVSLSVDPSDLAFWTAEEEYAPEPGRFDLFVGRSASDIRDRASFELLK